MAEERNPEQTEEQVEDLDVSAEESEDVKGGLGTTSGSDVSDTSVDYWHWRK
jgi:hypothetical protein